MTQYSGTLVCPCHKLALSHTSQCCFGSMIALPQAHQPASILLSASQHCIQSQACLESIGVQELFTCTALMSIVAQTLVLCPKYPRKLFGCRSSGMKLQPSQCRGHSSESCLGGVQPIVLAASWIGIFSAQMSLTKAFLPLVLPVSLTGKCIKTGAEQ